VLLREENSGSAGHIQHRWRWDAFDLHYQLHLFVLTLSWEKRIASVELEEDTAKAPHVNGSGVVEPEDDLWRPIEPRLDVGIDLVVAEAAAPKIDDLDP